MEREAIERLAVDSAAGQLNEDMQAMFTEYLAANPQAGKWAKQMLEIYKMTEMVINSKTKHAAMTRTVVKTREIFRWQPIARWAAVIVFSAFVGLTAGRWSKQPTVPGRPTMETASSSQESRQRYPDSESISGSFWRNKALAMFQARSSTAANVRITDSTLWERYRQFLKEKHYE